MTALIKTSSPEIRNIRNEIVFIVSIAIAKGAAIRLDEAVSHKKVASFV